MNLLSSKKVPLEGDVKHRRSTRCKHDPSIPEPVILEYSSRGQEAFYKPDQVAPFHGIPPWALQDWPEDDGPHHTQRLPLPQPRRNALVYHLELDFVDDFG